VYKLVELDGEPRVKLSNQIAKITLPGRTDAWRLYGKGGKAVADLLSSTAEEPPRDGRTILCRDPFDSMKRMRVTPSTARPLLLPCWRDGARQGEGQSIAAARGRLRHQLEELREDHTRFLNPTPYKVSVTEELFAQLQRIVEVEQPVAEVE
jgi:nicotinate phosphoribosyltransferase